MSLSVQRFTATHNRVTTECVLIHGWGMSGIIWQPWLEVIRSSCHVTIIDLPGYGDSEPMDYTRRHELLAHCVNALPERAVYIGYSLGGMLALHIARYFPQRVQAVVTLASNAKFVANEQWPQAMVPHTFESFYASVKKNAQQALKRFMALQVTGAQREKPLLKMLRATLDNHSIADTQTLLQSLECLSTLDNRFLITDISVPVLQVFGEKDQLVPATVATVLAKNDSVQVSVISDAPHSVFLSHPQHSWQLIETFLRSKNILPDCGKRALDKKQVARSFSRAAGTYDSVAQLQRNVGHQLQSYLPECDARVVLDLGCGTGYFSGLLQQRYQRAQIIGLDLAEGMVNFASAHHPGDRIAWLCGDAETIALADNSVDIIFSSLAIQWCEDNASLFAEVARVLKPQGSVVFSTLGPQTLHELRGAWQAVDNYVHVNRFVDQQTLVNCAQDAGLVCKQQQHAPHSAETTGFDEQIIALEYDKLKSLTRELKALGAHNVNNGRPSGLTGKQRVRALVQAYEKLRNQQGLLPASYQVWYGVWKKL